MGSQDRHSLVNHLEAAFPGLVHGGYRVTSPADPGYNCIAWAANDDTAFWWPSPDGFWPDVAPPEETVEAFELAYATFGYQRCDRHSLDEASEYVALYADLHGKPTHAARWLSGDRWTSKLGPSEDIEHPLSALEGTLYGRVAVVLKRARRQPIAGAGPS